MKLRLKEISIYLLSIILLLSSFYFSIHYLFNKDSVIINFIDSDIHEDFEIEITNNLDDIKYNTDNEEAFYNFSLINFKVSKLECLQLSDIKNIRVEFVYSESSDKKYYMVP